MKKGNVIELLAYQNQCHDDHQIKNATKRDASISEELKAAIQHLIHRLREGPQSSSN